MSCCFSFRNHTQNNLKLHLAFLDPPNKKTSRMQRTLITRKNCVCDYYHIKWMNSKKPEAVVRRCSVKKVFLKISQNSQKNT